MEISTMGKVFVAAKVENLEDVHLATNNHQTPEGIRTLEVTDALVDTGATTLSIPRRFIAQLGLRLVRTRKARTAGGVVTVQVYGPVRLTIQNRDCFCDAMELPDECPVLIGQIPLESMDFVVDLQGQRLIGNPAHGGEHEYEIY